MAGSRSRYRNAYEAGANGRDLPEGLSSLADEDPLIDQAHDAGRGGVDFDEWHRTNVEGQARPTSEPAPAPAPRRAPAKARGRRGLSRPQRPSLRRPLGGITRGADVPHTAGGVFLGAVIYALVLSVIEYGTKGPLLWFKAKFLNEAAPTKKAPSGAVLA